MTETTTKEINPAYNTIKNIDISKSKDELISDLSDNAKICIIKLGLKWPAMVGPNGSYISYNLLREVLMIPDLWTVTKLQKYSSCGHAGIYNSLIPDLYDVGIIERYKNKYIEYAITQTGREVINMFCINCNLCNNTRNCSKCNDGYQFELCTHVDINDCKYCNGTGVNTCDHCNDNDNNVCWKCGGNKATDCNWCTIKCDYCDSNRRLKCWACSSNKKCGCVERLERLNIGHELYDN